MPKQYKKIDSLKILVDDDLISKLEHEGWSFCGPMEAPKDHILRFERDVTDLVIDSGVILQPDKLIKRLKFKMN